MGSEFDRREKISHTINPNSRSSGTVLIGDRRHESFIIIGVTSDNDRMSDCGAVKLVSVDDLSTRTARTAVVTIGRS